MVGTGWICTPVCFLRSGNGDFWELLPSALLALGDFKIVSDFTIYMDFKSTAPQTAAAIGASSASRCSFGCVACDKLQEVRLYLRLRVTLQHCDKAAALHVISSFGRKRMAGKHLRALIQQSTYPGLIKALLEKFGL